MSTARSEKTREYYQKNRERILRDVHAYRERNREAILAKDRARYQANREERLAKDRVRYVKNREKILAYQREYVATHREEKRVYDVTYNLVNSLRHTSRALLWSRAHPDAKRAISSRYRARKAAAPVNDFSAAQWEELQAVFLYRCAYCGKRSKGHLSQDHITPLIKGGAHTASNIVPACRRCNSKKGARAPLCAVQPLLLTTTPAKGV